MNPRHESPGGRHPAPWWIAFLLGLAPTAFAGDEAIRDVARTGDMLQVGIPVAALVFTFFEGRSESTPKVAPAGWQDAAGRTAPGSLFDGMTMDGSPRQDLLVAMVRTEYLTYGLKYGIDSERPNGGGHSFPSGHTAAAFTGAEFIRLNYGWAPGVAAYVAAGFTGWSRVYSGNHWPLDVVAGAAIGIFSNHDLSNWELSFGRLSIVPSAMDFEKTGESLQPAIQFQLSF